MEHTGLTLRALGGSGENGRNCYLAEDGEHALLLDCGVLRAVCGTQVGGYPALTEDIARRLDAVLLSHAHEDHCAALPLLYALGFRGMVYASPETIEAVPGMLKKWRTFVESSGGTLPYSEQDAEKIRFSPLKIGKNEICDLSVLTGRSGHTVGSLWFRFPLGGKTVLYAGDCCTCSRTLCFDALPVCDAAFLDFAYAGRSLSQQAQYDALSALLESGKTLLLPVPVAGRGCDLLLHFLAQGADVYAEEAIVRRCEALLAVGSWVRPELPGAIPKAHLHPLCSDTDRLAACQVPGAVILTTDGMLTAPGGKYLLRQLQSRPDALCVLTGHAAPGTPAERLTDSAWRAEHAVRMGVQNLTVKVHPDETDMALLLRQCDAKQVVFFHAPADACQNAIEKAKPAGVSACCLKPEEALKIGR